MAWKTINHICCVQLAIKSHTREGLANRQGKKNLILDFFPNYGWPIWPISKPDLRIITSAMLCVETKKRIKIWGENFFLFYSYSFIRSGDICRTYVRFVNAICSFIFFRSLCAVMFCSVKQNSKGSPLLRVRPWWNYRRARKSPFEFKNCNIIQMPIHT